MSALLHNPTFWVAVGFVIFVAAVGKRLFKAAVAQLDARAERIRQHIDDAERLRAEAQTLLATYQRKHRDAMKEAGAILGQAKDVARRAAEESSAAADTAMQRREQQAIEKIAQAEVAALREVREKAVEIAVAAARAVVAGQMKDRRGQALIDTAIKDLPVQLH